MPGALAIFTPVVIGFLLGPAGLAGLLAGALVSGFMLAITMSNAGGAWDNAKKWVEKGNLKINGEVKKKKTEEHAAVVTGDTVGDPFKDTSGPALNVLIKLMTLVSLVLAPRFKSTYPPGSSAQQRGFDETGVIIAVIVSVVVLPTLICLQMKFNKEYAEQKKKASANNKPAPTGYGDKPVGYGNTEGALDYGQGGGGYGGGNGYSQDGGSYGGGSGYGQQGGNGYGQQGGNGYGQQGGGGYAQGGGGYAQGARI